MPQMAPLNWLTLFVFFITIFMIFNVLSYFMFLYTPEKNNINFKLNKINWKW